MSALRRTRSGVDDGPSTWVTAAVVSGAFVALLYVVELADVIADHRLDRLGVEPRSADGLWGILFAPVLHGSWTHLEANTVPALVLGFLVLFSGIAKGVEATAVIWVVGGVGVWLVAPTNSIHLGASVLIFGWLVYLMLRGIWTRRVGQIILGIMLFLLYGTLLLGVLPGQPGISWQGHLFGAVGGALAAWLIRFDE
ncbi:MAG: rhomboid family intramembrane serine protease [Nocardioides sp.]|uniref:rhomboid family intramembrane serine protease n=1 Tax=Nocardioides sp. TaxID=35761 RepID=UPI0023A24EC7|nr:rhomboid family intramembrane serine protease [Nocardioides sp.]MDE0777966.1 rhomboid family intramembrane serine protease [Nocardioides sp.]